MQPKRSSPAGRVRVNGAHRRAGRKDKQVGLVKAAQKLVEVAEPRGDAGKLPLPLIGRFSL